MNARDLSIAEWSLGTAGVAFGAFNAFADNIPSIRSHCREPNAAQYVADLHAGYVAASILTGFTGLAVSLITRSAWPAVAAGIGGVAMVGLFESHVPPQHRLLSQWAAQPDYIDAPAWRVLGGT